jgi:CSLREA domain-containing protein
MKQLCKREQIAASLILALLLAGFGPTHQAYAATIEATTFADNLTNNGDCSLREAIQAANTDTAVDACPAGSGAEMDTIQLSAGTYALSLGNLSVDEDLNQTGDLDILSNLIIEGVDANTTRIDGGEITSINDRIFSIQPDVTVILRGFELTHGASATDGGSIHNDHGTLTLDGVNVAHSTAGGNGGGIYNDHGVLTISGSIRDNTAGGNGGGIDNDGGTLTINGAQLNNNVAGGSGGAISNNDVMTLERVWLHDNWVSGDDGGGIYNLGTASVTHSFIHNGSAPQNGGNIYSGDSMGLSSLTISATTISRGSAGANGGGLFNDGALALTNITIAENSATSGGGIYNVEDTQPLNLTNTTIVSNTHAAANPGEGIVTLGAGLTLKNTLVAFNGALGNCAGSINSVGYNLDSGNTCIFTATGDLINTNPLLSPLQDNGGVTFSYGGAAPSYALQPGSPATNGGTNAGCPAVDQRGMARPHGAHCDIGAYEANDVPHAIADSYSTDEDTPLVVNSPGLLFNDSDPDNDVITATLLTTPAHGALTLNQSGAFSYTPNANYHGEDNFSYQIGDGSLTSASTLVTLTVSSVNDPPIAANDTAGTTIDTTLIIPVALLLSNDADIEGDLLDISDVRGNSARGGRVMLAGSSVVYTPPAHFSGVDSLIYTLSDRNGGTASGTVTVTVGIRLLYLPMARR